MKAKTLLSNLTFLTILVTILFTLTTCKKKTEDTPQTNDSFMISPKAKFILDNDWQSAIRNVDSTRFTLTFDKGLVGKYSFVQGDLIVSSVGNGLLRKIDTITQSGNNIQIQTSQATLTDLIQQGNIDFKAQLTISKIKSIKYYYPGIHLTTNNLKSPADTLFNWEINTDIAPHLHLQGNFRYTQDFIIQIQIDLFEGLKKVKFGFEGAEDFNLEMVAGEQFELNKEITIATIYFTPIFIPIPIPPFTIVVVPVFDVKLGVDGYANANISTSLEQNFTIETGIQYLKESGWSNYLNYNKSFNYTPPQLNMNAGAEAYLKPELNLLIFDVVGPYLDGKGYGKIEADLTQTPWWKMYYGLTLSAGAKADILGDVLFDFSVDLLNWEQIVGQATSGVPPTVTTASVTNIAETTATGGGNVTSQGTSSVTARGVCWSTSANPTVSDVHTTDGSGTGSFTSNITGLTGNTPYYVRAYATNSFGTTYGDQKQFTTSVSVLLPILSTADVINITQNSAQGGGTITSDGGSTVTERGVCWSTSNNPTIAGSHSSDGTGIGSFTSNITGLSANTPYYVRAFASNSAGTAYGDQKSFTTSGGPCPGMATITDARDGKVYPTIQIGTQCWLQKNMNIGNRINGTQEQNPSNLEKYCYNDQESSCDLYGGLYQWNEMMQGSVTPGVQGICPSGWHIPTDAEWTNLANYLGGESIAGGKMKETGTIHWEDPNTGATNSSGFTALPAGGRYNYGYFNALTSATYYWSSSEYSSTYGWGHYLYYSTEDLRQYNAYKTEGYSVRCLKN